MSLARETVIKKMMWKEVALKGVPACYTFIVMAIMIFFYHWGLDSNITIIRISCILAILANIARLAYTVKIQKEALISEKHKEIIRICIWLNTIAWSFIFGLGAMKLEANSYHLAILVTMVAGFVAASMVTLSYDKTIFYPWQILILGPLAFFAFMQWKTGENPQAIYFVFCCVMYFIYQSKQVKIFHQQIIDRFNYQLDLEKSLMEVNEAQEKLVNQTASLIHAAKITGLGEMAGGLSHEINNSLQVILGSNQQIQRELQKLNFSHPSIDGKLEQSIAATMKIKSVVDGLRYFSQEMENVPKEVVPLRQIMEQTLGYTQELLKAHGVSLIVSYFPQVRINCHPLQITQILFNLIKNSDDAIRKAGNEKWIDIKFEETKDFILIMVSNSGETIPRDIQDKLFQPFFSTKDVNAGSGLSLSISRGIALDHKGDLFFKPQEKFTTFVLKLPKSP